MGLFDNLFSSDKNSSDSLKSGIIESGRNKNEGGHDHRTNKGKDRTPSQKEGDKAKRKP
jgi:hypothetical protein